MLTMLELANPNYQPDKEASSPGSPLYWMSQIVMRSGSQHLKSIEQDILGSAYVTTTSDIQSVFVSSNRQTANVLTMGANLVADNMTGAMTKASGLTLLAMRKAGVNVDDLALEDGRLVSGATLAKAVAEDPEATIYDHSYSLSPQLEDIFIDMQASMVYYGAPATY